MPDGCEQLGLLGLSEGPEIGERAETPGENHEVLRARHVGRGGHHDRYRRPALARQRNQRVAFTFTQAMNIIDDDQVERLQRIGVEEAVPVVLKDRSATVDGCVGDGRNS